MWNLSDMNNLYNSQDTCLLCEIFENGFEIMQKMYGFNPRRCNALRTFSGCIERELSKVVIALPTNIDGVKMFEKTSTGGFSCANTRLGLDTEIFLPNHSQADFNKMNIDKRSVFQLSKTLTNDDRNSDTKSYLCTKKHTHINAGKRIYSPLFRTFSSFN